MRLTIALCVALVSLQPVVSFAAEPKADPSDQLTTYVAQYEPGPAKPPELISTLDPADPFRPAVEAGAREASKVFRGLTGTFRLRRLGTFRGDVPGSGAALVVVLVDAPLATLELQLPPAGETFVYVVRELRARPVGARPTGVISDRGFVGPSKKVVERFDEFSRVKVDPSKTQVTVGEGSFPAAQWTAAEWKGELKPGGYTVVTELEGGVFPPDVLSIRAAHSKAR